MAVFLNIHLCIHMYKYIVQKYMYNKIIYNLPIQQG